VEAQHAAMKNARHMLMLWAWPLVHVLTGRKNVTRPLAVSMTQSIRTAERAAACRPGPAVTAAAGTGAGTGVGPGITRDGQPLAIQDHSTRTQLNGPHDG
jgi:hypothetical protein